MNIRMFLPFFRFHGLYYQRFCINFQLIFRELLYHFLIILYFSKLHSWPLRAIYHFFNYLFYKIHYMMVTILKAFMNQSFLVYSQMPFYTLFFIFLVFCYVFFAFFYSLLIFFYVFFFFFCSLIVFIFFKLIYVYFMLLYL